MNNHKDTMIDLSQFTGTEKYYKHFLGYLYTDGVKYLADKAQAYWLLDAIFSYKRKEPFQLWILKVNSSNSAILTMQEDSNSDVLIKQIINFTDFPINEIKFYLIDNTLILPSEY